MKYRLYTFVNHVYMSPIQWGIQTAHVVSALSVKYCAGTPEYRKYFAWAVCEPTILVCRGGNVGMLKALHEVLTPLADALNLPYTKFHEDQDSLGGALTSVGILVPELLYDAAMTLAENRVPLFNYADGKSVPTDSPEYALLTILKTARLA